MVQTAIQISGELNKERQLLLAWMPTQAPMDGFTASSRLYLTRVNLELDAPDPRYP